MLLYGRCECFVMHMFYVCVHPVAVLNAAFCMTSSGVLMKSIGAEVLRPDALCVVGSVLNSYK